MLLPFSVGLQTERRTTEDASLTEHLFCVGKHVDLVSISFCFVPLFGFHVPVVEVNLEGGRQLSIQCVPDEVAILGGNDLLTSVVPFREIQAVKRERVFLEQTAEMTPC